MVIIMKNNSQLDRYDEQIISILGENGRLPVTEIAKRIGISKSPCQARLKRLLSEGYIIGFKAVFDPVKLGREHVAFTEVKLSDTRELALEAFNQAVRQVPEVEQCHMIAGQFDYLLKVRTSNITDYRKVLGNLSTLPNVANTSTFVSMESIIDTVVLENKT